MNSHLFNVSSESVNICNLIEAGSIPSLTYARTGGGVVQIGEGGGSPVSVPTP